MAVVQSTYSDRMHPAVAGMRADMRAWDGLTRTCETVAGIGFGLAVGRGDTDSSNGCKLAGSLPDFLGVSQRDVTLEARATIDKYAEHENVGILTAGTIWVVVTGAPGPDSPVHYSATTGVFAASGGSGPVLGARWMTETVTVGGGVLVCKLHLPNRDSAAAYRLSPPVESGVASLRASTDT